MTKGKYTANISPDGSLKIQSSDWQPVVTCLADVEPRSVNWLWPNRIPLGRLTLLAGVPGLGKSFVTCDLAARITTGADFPDGCKTEVGSVLLIACEDDPGDTIRPRLDAHNADSSKVHLLSAARLDKRDGSEANEVMFTLNNISILRQTLIGIPDCRLVVIDPIGSYLGSGTKANSDNEVRAVLAPLAKLAEEFNVAILIIAHTRKAEARHADDMVMGSRAFTGIARAVWHLMEDPDNADRRLLLPGKCNIASKQDGLSFQIAGFPATIRWNEEPESRTANEVLSEIATGKGKGSSAVDEAIEWLKHYLSDGQQPGKQVVEAAKKDGIAERTLRRASDQLKVRKKPGNFGGPWVWELPDSTKLPNTENLVNTEDTGAELANNPSVSAELANENYSGDFDDESKDDCDEVEVEF